MPVKIENIFKPAPVVSWGEEVGRGFKGSGLYSWGCTTEFGAWGLETRQFGGSRGTSWLYGVLFLGLRP